MVSGINCQVPPRPRAWASRAAVIVLAFGAVQARSASAAPPQASAQGPVFQKDILPIFQRNCLRCHALKVKKGGLDLSTPEGVLAGGTSGPVVVPQQPAASKLYDVVHTR